MFAFLILSEWRAPTLLKQYMAELASALSGMNAQLCGAPSLQKEALISDVEQTLQEELSRPDLTEEDKKIPQCLPDQT